MSYEGYSQFLCKKGHYWTVDCYLVECLLEKNMCPICHQPAIWENMVDETNGSYEDNIRIDGYVELEVKNKKICECCKRVLETTYKIPFKHKRKYK